jgi:hypothetical protein
VTDMYQRRLERLKLERSKTTERLSGLKPHSEARAAIRRELVKITVNVLRVENFISRQIAIKAKKDQGNVSAEN